MRFIENKLYLTINECVECGMNYRTITDAKDKGSKCWNIIKDPSDKRNILVGYETLKPVYQKMVLERFGNPYDHVARTPILNMVVNDFKANEYYKAYRYDGGKYLPIENVNKYTRATGWLHMLREMDRVRVKKELGLGIADFFQHVGELMAIEKERGKKKDYTGLEVLPADFPSTYQNLLKKVRAFASAMENESADAAYQMLISPSFGNKSAAKIGKVAASSTVVRQAHDELCLETSIF